MEKQAEFIRKAQRILLSTHRECDGDGLGAQLAMYFALKKIGKKVDVINVDRTPKKYKFLEPDSHIRYFDEKPEKLNSYDLCLIFDTNDERLLYPLFSEIKTQCAQVLFIDHHPVLEHGPHPSSDSLIDVKVASTGELAYNLIRELQIPLDPQIAQALYTSVVFDTQLYRFIRNSSSSHTMTADLLNYSVPVEKIHRALFGNQTPEKISFLASALGRLEYFFNGRMALIKVKATDLLKHQLDPDDSRDVVDFIMNIDILEVAVLIREDAQNQYKVSLRSKGDIAVLPLAESLGGGGHVHSAGAFVCEELRRSSFKNHKGHGKTPSEPW